MNYTFFTLKIEPKVPGRFSTNVNKQGLGEDDDVAFSDFQA